MEILHNMVEPFICGTCWCAAVQRQQICETAPAPDVNARVHLLFCVFGAAAVSRTQHWLFGIRALGQRNQPCNWVPKRAVPCKYQTVQCCTLLCCNYYTVLYCTTLCCTTRPHHHPYHTIPGMGTTSNIMAILYNYNPTATQHCTIPYPTILYRALPY